LFKKGGHVGQININCFNNSVKQLNCSVLLLY
jgi:hypothetical protein